MANAGKALPRVTELDEDVVHYVAPPTADSVTLCGLTDFIGHRNLAARLDDILASGT